MLKTNFLIIGSGIAGMTLAIKLAEYFPTKKITIVTKAGESNTRYAQGGVAAVLDKSQDSFKKHIEDTLKAGDGLCDIEVVKHVVEQGPERIKELLDWGARFDRDPKQRLLLSREGGHTERRIVHHNDTTGKEIERALLQRIQNLDTIEVLSNCFAIDLEAQSSAKRSEKTIKGAYIFYQHTQELSFIFAQTVTLATGGIGQLYTHSTNPSIATGDGIAMALRVGAQVKSMEFIQFHPTVFFEKSSGTSFLISEAVRGHGAYLRNSKGHRFTLDYDERGELASRDIVSKAIYWELSRSKEKCVYLDCTHLNVEEFKKHFPNIYQTCLSKGVDISKDWIPVVPAVHYLCGGIVVDKDGKTNLSNLFACGECSCTGLHGANRLASNSLLEALIYAHSIFEYHIRHYHTSNDIFSVDQHLRDTYKVVKESIALEQMVDNLRALMSENAGIVRNTNALIESKKKLDLLLSRLQTNYPKEHVNTGLCQYRNMLAVAQVIMEQSIARKENKGGYYNMQL